MTAPASTVTLRLRLTTTAERHVRGGHPWVYSDSVTEQNRDGDIGDLAVIYDKKDKFLALGLYDPTSPIRVRVLHAGKPARATPEWWLERLLKAKTIRLAHFDDDTTGFRWVSGESDGFPGLVLDRYAEVLVLKLYSAIWLPMLPNLVGWILTTFGASALVLRLSRNIQDIARSRWGVSEGCLHGHTENLVVFRENGIAFEAEVIQGQKTGFYLDQRDNRARVERLAADQDVLNVFSFSGGFSLYAARGGARSVTDLDISKHALESARRNFALNDWAAKVPHHQIQGDAFEWLASGPRQLFDLIICDPPSLARRESDRAGAIRAYHTLASSCLKRLRPGGILVAASCSAHVSADEFLGAVFDAADRLCPTVELWRSGHAVDHPASFAEANYLKCLALRVSRA
jgi:23S rRNA (cytosine1962-C5)-methyltransferase